MSNTKGRSRWGGALGAMAIVAALTVWISSSAFGATPTAHTGKHIAGPTIRIGAKSFTESLLAGYLYAELLQHHGYKVDTSKFNLGTELLAQTAITHNQIDMYPEYDGTGYTVVLSKQSRHYNAQKVLATLRRVYKKRWNLVWLNPALMNDTNGFATTSSFANANNMYNLSAMARNASKIRLEVLTACLKRLDCLLGLEQIYGVKQSAFKSVTTIDTAGLKYAALLHGQADVAQVFTTDPQISLDHLVLLKDNKHFVPPDHIAPVVRGGLLKTYPGIRSLLNRVEPFLTTNAFRTMDYAVDGKGQKPAAVARKFLKAHGWV